MRREAGFVTVAVAGLTLVLVAFSAVVATLGAVAVDRHRAAAAADLAALAGAGHVLDGPARACGAARGTRAVGRPEQLPAGRPRGHG